MADFMTIARPYARAVFEIAARDATLDAWSKGLRCAAVVMQNDTARRHIAQPSLSQEASVAYLHTLTAAVDDAVVLKTPRGTNFLRLLAANGRLAALPEIATRFDALKARAENKVKVRLTAATQVDEAMQRKFAESLQRRLGRGVDLEAQIDTDLLGGAVLRADDRVIDGSIRSRLQRLAEKLMA
jgi:F-type H+-transporting ATPase subunit delta